ncbi:MAG: tRNA epoxyqueuosine(34) reductase QueG [Chitinophagales bacterium]|nr:tRNA epoxyqueuosine(34) reductase QueG [Chitinophagales bacterium]
MSLSIQKHTKIVKEIARELGFDFCGISKAEFLESEAHSLEDYIKKGKNGKMQYLGNHFDKRLDPTKLVDGAKSVVSLMMNYCPHEKQNPNSYKLSKYAYGEDYHHVIKKKLWTFIDLIRERIGEVAGRAFVDSAPVLEKAWAQKSGLGWRGKNALMIQPRNGSFYFLAELVIDLELVPDGPIKDYCGTCTRCIDACPTGALDEPYKVDGSKCISYFTIELRDELLPKEMNDKMENWMFGCDICQDVCPWNRFSKPHSVIELNPRPGLMEMNYEDWDELTHEVFSKFFSKSAVKRTKYSGLKRNIEFLKNIKEEEEKRRL